MQYVQMYAKTYNKQKMIVSLQIKWVFLLV